MVIKKVMLFVLIGISLAFTNRDSVIKSTSVILTPESSILLKGTTNVNTFSCLFNTNKFKNPIQISYKIEDNKMVFNDTALILDSNCFDCGGKAINNDFQKILKADKYPQIILFLKEIYKAENVSDVQALVNIEIAGITKGYKVPVKVKKSKGLLITGNLSISLLNYKLEAPKKLFGLITVDDKIDIYFQLAVKEN